ncbi:MAG TPA: hypothetical protein VFX23_08600 [Limnobacter sp.]|uniref:hypothetical protein n=1 Tax=Limnobacter sp. TaxID=2003368 RepID=UPI002E2FFE5E|nr:hypothetical protein [Limnobacter sp.]HEX5486044.1 hypothetical protein [Limnobacter sp.]
MLEELPYMVQNSPKKLESTYLINGSHLSGENNCAKNPFCNLLGFHTPDEQATQSGPCALAALLHFYSIGWSHIPKAANGSPDNDLFLKEVMRWSETPDQPEERLDTSPAALIAALNRAALHADWYANGTDEDNLSFIRRELLNDRPVIVLLNPSPLDSTANLEWQVVFQMDMHSVYTKTCHEKTHTRQWSKQEFCQLLNNPLGGCNRTLITAAK